MAVLSDSQLRSLAQRHFGDLGQATVDLMVQMAKLESSGNTAAYNGAGLDRSHGLWQINVHPKANPDLAGMNLADPEQNAKAARIILDRQGPQAWSTFSAAKSALGKAGNVVGDAARFVGGEVKRGLNPVPNVKALDFGPFRNPRPAAPGAAPAGAGPSAPGTASQQRYSPVQNATQTPEALVNELRAEARRQYEEDKRSTDENVRPYATETYLGTLSEIAALEEGIIKTPEGYITSEELSSGDPAIREQARLGLYTIAEKAAKGAGNALLGSMGLPGYNFPEDDSAQLQQDYENRRGELADKLGLDEINLTQAANKTSRHLSGLAESRSRSSLVTDSLLKAAPLASGGKTSFSGSDLGGGVGLLLQQAGISNPSAMNLLNYPSSVNIDPAALMAQGDQSLGVTGALPEVPGLLSGPGDIPQRPALNLAPQGQSYGGGYSDPQMQWQGEEEEDELAGAPPIVQQLMAQEAERLSRENPDLRGAY